jgi:5-methylcytosine-specific restriction endonuclease McrA
MLTDFYATCAIPKGKTRKQLKAKKQRAAVTVRKGIRAQIVARAEGRCERCKWWIDDWGHAHHRIPRSRGGRWTLGNIEYLCAKCHRLAHLKNQL